MRGIGWALLAAVAVALGCGSDAETDRLQSDCIRDTYYIDDPLPRVLEDGASCSNIGHGDCPGELASECVHYCGFDRCQASSCASDADCAWLGADYECQEYVVVGDPSYGSWCKASDCPKGTLGCPCRDGRCGGEATCGSDDVCHDTCPAGCRAGSVCCGGAFCGGDCIGTPCC